MSPLVAKVPECTRRVAAAIKTSAFHDRHRKDPATNRARPPAGFPATAPRAREHRCDLKQPQDASLIQCLRRSSSPRQFKPPTKRALVKSSSLGGRAQCARPKRCIGNWRRGHWAGITHRTFLLLTYAVGVLKCVSNEIPKEDKARMGNYCHNGPLCSDSFSKLDVLYCLEGPVSNGQSPVRESATPHSAVLSFALLSVIFTLPL